MTTKTTEFARNAEILNSIVSQHDPRGALVSAGSTFKHVERVNGQMVEVQRWMVLGYQEAGEAIVLMCTAPGKSPELQVSKRSFVNNVVFPSNDLQMGLLWVFFL